MGAYTQYVCFPLSRLLKLTSLLGASPIFICGSIGSVMTRKAVSFLPLSFAYVLLTIALQIYDVLYTSNDGPRDRTFPVPYLLVKS